MDKQKKTYSLLIVAIIGIIAFILFLLFVPDMSTTLIDTVPQYPPESNIVSTNEALITSAVTVDKSNVKNIVSAMERPSEYFSETQSILSHSSGSATYKRNRWVKGDFERVDVSSSSGGVITHYVYSKNNVYIWREGSRSYHKASRGEFEPDDAQMMMTYEDLLSAADEDIVTAQLTLFEGSSCIYTELKSTLTGYTERFWISASTGLLLHGQTLDSNGSIVYSITSKQTDISPQLDETFKLPDGKFPE